MGEEQGTRLGNASRRAPLEQHARKTGGVRHHPRILMSMSPLRIVNFGLRLLRQGANPTRSHFWNGFPDVLQHAIQHAGDAELEVVRMLLEAGADPNYHERGTSTTALQVCNNPAVAELLREHGARVDG